MSVTSLSGSLNGTTRVYLDGLWYVVNNDRQILATLHLIQRPLSQGEPVRKKQEGLNHVTCKTRIVEG
jgi:hypothetical protein